MLIQKFYICLPQIDMAQNNPYIGYRWEILLQIGLAKFYEII